MPKGTPKLVEALASICDGARNFTVAQAAIRLAVPQNRVHKLVHEGRLHPVRVSGHLIFSRSDLERHRRTALELDLAQRFTRGDHPLDVYLEAEGKVAMRDVERVLRDWARLTGVWLVEGPRGSYARWLQRFGLLRVSPRALRRFVEAMLVDQDMGERVRAYFEDERLAQNATPRRRAARARAQVSDVA